MLVAGLLFTTGTAAAAPGAHAARLQASAAASSPAPSAASQAAALAQMTGLSPGQVTTRAICGAPAPGQATCAASVVVLRSTGAPVHPPLHRQLALADVRTGQPSAPVPPPGGAGTARPADAASTGQAAPAAGTPAWLQQAYDLSYLSAKAGANQTIAVIDAFNDPSAASDLAVFRSAYGLPACTPTNGCFRKVNESGSTAHLPSDNAAWAAEEALDLDAVSSLCPNCHLILVEAASARESDLTTAMATGAALGANELSNSWTIPSAQPFAEPVTFPGVATVAATGDNGYVSPGGDVYPAATPDVTAVGGTTLGAATGARGYGEVAWSDGGSGCDTVEPKPPYQPESGCPGRAYADVSADADPTAGLDVYDTGSGGWTLMGGTSLATPLVAAFDAVTGVAGVTPAWAYADAGSGLLNDPASGTNGLCAASIFSICQAGAGYDGPTGAGSISGQVATGGPGIGGPDIAQSTGTGFSYTQGVTDTSATLTGGVYPNGIDTTYFWQYGTTTAYGSQTMPTDAGPGTAAVSVTGALAGLSPSTTYHYRLVASNSLGTTYGYDYTVTTASPAIAPPQPASDGGTTAQSQTTTTASAAPQTPSSSTIPGGATTTPAPTTSTTPVATTPTTSTPTTTPVAPPPISPVATSPAASRVRAAAPVIVVRPRLRGRARVGATVRVTGGLERDGTVTGVRFERCARTCVTTGRGAGGSHRVTAADAGFYLRAWVTVTGPGGAVSTWAAGTIGPIRSGTAGTAPLRPGATTVRGSSGRALAWVTTRRSRSRRIRGAAVELARVSAVHGAVRVWACVSSRRAVTSCTVPITVHGAATVRVTLRAGQRAVLIAVA